MSIFFYFCLYTISGGNEQVSYQDEVLFYLSVELDNHSLCLHGNKHTPSSKIPLEKGGKRRGTNHGLYSKTYRHRKHKQKNIWPIIIWIAFYASNRKSEKKIYSLSIFLDFVSISEPNNSYIHNKHFYYENFYFIGNTVSHTIGSLPKRGIVSSYGWNILYTWFYTTKSWNNNRIHRI